MHNSSNNHGIIYAGWGAIVQEGCHISAVEIQIYFYVYVSHNKFSQAGVKCGNRQYDVPEQMVANPNPL